MSGFYQKHKQALDKAAFFSLVSVCVFVFFRFLFKLVAPFFFGLAAALIMEPLIRLLIRKCKFSRRAAAAACLIALTAAISSIGITLVSSLLKQLGSLIENAPVYVDEIIRRLDSMNEWFINVNADLPDVKTTLINAVTGLFGDGVKDNSWRIVSNMPDFFISVILALISAFFFMKDGPSIGKGLTRRSPEWLTRNATYVKRGLGRAAAGYFKAQFILMSIVCTICIAGLLLLRNPYALLIGIAVAVLDFLPVLGSGTLLLPWAAFNLLTGRYSFGAGLLVLYGVITVVRQVMEPKILSEQIGVHPLITLISIYAGFKIFGFFGIIIGPSLVIVFKAFNEEEKTASNGAD